MFTQSRLLRFLCATVIALAAPSSVSTHQALQSNLGLSIFDHSLYVENAPQTPQPYITSPYSTLNAIAIGNYVFRFAATRNSTNNAFSVVLSSGSGSRLQGLMTTTPHTHQRHYETFYPCKGSMQMWAADQSRILTPGDFSAVPENVTHIFQILDPDTFMVGIQAPGGFEDFFGLIGRPLTGDPLDTPFNPTIPVGPAQTPPPQAYQALAEIGDFYPDTTYTPRMDLVDGSAPASNWHTGPNTPANDSETPYFMARDLGPFYLNDKHGLYQVVQPLVTQTQSGDNNFTMATLSLSLPLGTQQGTNSSGVGTAPLGPPPGVGGPPSIRARQNEASNATYCVDASSYFLVEEGRFVATIADNPPALLVSGEQLFVPSGTTFSYYSAAPFTKVLYASGGVPGSLDELLISEGRDWTTAMFPLI